MALGGLTAAGGMGIQGAGAGIEAGGKGIETAGKGVEKAGKGVEKSGQKIEDRGKKISQNGQKQQQQGRQKMQQAQAKEDEAHNRLQKAEQKYVAGEKPPAMPQMKEPGKMPEKMVGKAPIPGTKTAKQMAGVPTGEQKAPGKEGAPPLPKPQEMAKGGAKPDEQARKQALAAIKRQIAKIKKAAKKAAALARGEINIMKTLEDRGLWLSSKALMMSWLNIVSSWGLLLIWINIHFVLRYIVRAKFVCGFGEEWTSGLISGNAVSSLTSKFGGTEMLKYAEIILMFLCDALFIILILIAFILLVLPAMIAAMGYIGLIKFILAG